MSQPTVAAILARNVRVERTRRDWKQEDLAARTPWSTTVVSRIESGRRRLDIDDLLMLCQAFDVNLHRLLDGADPQAVTQLGLREWQG